jgi:hypothetical protein
LRIVYDEVSFPGKVLTKKIVFAFAQPLQQQRIGACFIMVPNPQPTSSYSINGRRMETGARRVKTEVLKSTIPATFGYAEPRSQEIDDDYETVTEHSHRESGLGGLGSQQHSYYQEKEQPYEENVFFVQQSHRGVRMGFQANSKMFMLVAGLVIGMLALPIVLWLLSIFVRVVTGSH